MGQLVQVGGQKGEIEQGDDQRDGNLPAFPGAREDHGHHDAGDGHGAGDRQPIGRRQVLRLLKNQHDENNQDQQHPVNRADVDLRFEMAGSVVHLQKRHDAGVDPLVNNGKDSADQRLGSDDRGQDGEKQKGDVEKRRLPADHAEENVLGFRMLEDVRPLPQVVDDQGGKDEIPGMDDRPAPQVPHVGVERFAAGGAEDHLGEDEKSGETVFHQEFHGIPGAHRLQHRRITNHRNQPGNRQGQEPGHHQWPEKAGHLVGALELENEQANGDEGGDRDQRRLRRVFQTGNQFQALDRRKDGNRRRDDPVPQQQADSQIGKKDHEAQLPSRFQERPENFLEDDGPPLALAPQAHGQPGVLHRDEQDQGPDDQGKNAEDVVGRGLDEGDDDRKGVDRTGADVAEHQPHGFDDTAPKGRCCLLFHRLTPARM